MKVALLTLKGFNYGGCLQAYALGHVIEQLWGNNVNYEYLNYERNFYKDSMLWLMRKLGYGLLRKDDIPSWSIKDFWNIVFLRKKAEKAEAIVEFEEFWKSIPETQILRRKDIKKIENKYDMFIVGSDQVWNCGQLNLDKTFLLDFVKDGKKKGSYASSIGLKEIPKKYEKAYYECWKQFEYLSCREKSGVKIIKDLTGQDVSWVLDPTLLLKAEQWEEIADRSISKGKSYILLYMLDESEKLFKFAQSFAREQHKELICIYSKIEKNGSIGPRQWLGYFWDADFIITNSFHGIAFSINLKKDFYVAIGEKSFFKDSSSRITDLLERLNLQKRLLCNLEATSKHSSINYEYVNGQLEEFRLQSIEYLRKMIKENEE